LDAGLYSWTPATSQPVPGRGFNVREARVHDSAEARKLIRILADGAGAGLPSRGHDWAMVRERPKAEDQGNAGKTDPRDIPVPWSYTAGRSIPARFWSPWKSIGCAPLCVLRCGQGQRRRGGRAGNPPLVESITWVRPEIHAWKAIADWRARSWRPRSRLSKHETVVLLEDDCVPQRYFFEFMAAALDKYRFDENVFGVSGYTVPLQDGLLKRYPYDLYFCPRISSWGWATWKRLEPARSGSGFRLPEGARRENRSGPGGNDIRYSIEGMLQGNVKDVWTLPWVLSVYAKRVVSPIHRFAYRQYRHGRYGVHCGKTDK